MIQKIKTLILSLSFVILAGVPLAMPTTVMAAEDQISKAVCYGANNLKISANPDGTCPAGTDQTDKVNRLITQIINIFSVIVGIVAVIMIIWGGFKYITSGGSQEKVSSAKNTLLYAIIGLIIVALAQIIVKFVLNKTVSG